VSRRGRERPERRVAAAFGLSAAGSAGFAIVYALGGQVQLEGVLLAVAFAGLAYGFVVWAASLMPGGTFVEEHEPFEPPPAERREFEAELERDVAAIGRRRFLGRLLGLAVGAVAVAVLFPVRSLLFRGPGPSQALSSTPWRAGVALVTEEGQRVRADDLAVGTVLTVFPEGHLDAGDAATLLVRLDPRELRAGDDAGTGDAGLVAYSKLCTHAGCPVGLYEQATEQLFCPCHQSVFDLLDGARPTAGPATRPLPRLPIEVDPAGWLRATGDFPEPVGPGFWRRP